MEKSLWYEAVSSAPNFPFFIKVSQNFFAFDVAQVTKGSLGCLSSIHFSTCLVLGEVVGPFPEIES